MKRFFYFLLFAAAAVSCSDAPGDGAGASSDPDKVRVAFTAEGARKGELIVKFKSDVADRIAEKIASAGNGRTRAVTIASVDELLAEVGVERIHPVFGPTTPGWEERERKAGLHQWYRIGFDRELELKGMVEKLQGDENLAVIEYVHEPGLLDNRPVAPLKKADVAARTRAALPADDPFLPQQWHYFNDGTFPRVTSAGMDINLFPAWQKIPRGDGRVIVAVFDTGVQYTHPDLAANMWTNPEGAEAGLHGWNCVSGTPDVNWDYVSQQVINGTTYYSHADHGTHVAGTIAAVTGNGVGVSGIASGVKIMTMQILESSTKADESTADKTDFPYGMKWACQHGAVISQNSWGYSYNPDENTVAEFVSSMKKYFERGGESSIKAAVDFFIDNAGNAEHFPDSPMRGGVVIFAAGNDGEYGEFVAMPSAYERIVSVGSVGSDGLPAYYTNYGPENDVAAPGGDYLNSDFMGTLKETGDDVYYRNGGWRYVGTDEPVTGQFSISYGLGENGSVLSCMLNDPSITYMDGREVDSPLFGYGWSQGTSMACPHVSGIAALAVSYAASAGRTVTADELFAALVAGTHNNEAAYAGSKPYQWLNGGGDIRSPLKLGDYAGKMGSGRIDAAKVLALLAGEEEIEPGYFPNLTMKLDATPRTIALSKYFIGYSDLTAKSDNESVVKASVADGVLTLAPGGAEGAAKVTVTGKSKSGRSVSRDFVVIVRKNVNNAGGWL